MDNQTIRYLSSGVNQQGVRNHNERLLLTMLQRNGAMAGADLAQKAGLSPQTVSVILRKLEADGLLERGAPVRGKVGKPSTPMALAKNGLFSIGMKIGRRRSDLLLLDIHGNVRAQMGVNYNYPMPKDVFGFLGDGLKSILSDLPDQTVNRICGIGIAVPFELWRWHELVGAHDRNFRSWKDVDFAKEVAKFSDLPIYIVNDATAACHAEHLYGRGKEFRDYGYFFIGSFVGGGVVVNDTVFEGNQGNAGAFGSIRSTGPNGQSRQLIDVASLHLLEGRLVEAGHNPKRLWDLPLNWDALEQYVGPWVNETAQQLAKAALSICSVIDFEAILIDGAIPPAVRAQLVERVRVYLLDQDTRGLLCPKIKTGSIGDNARAIGAASAPIFAQFFLNANAGLSAV